MLLQHIASQSDRLEAKNGHFPGSRQSLFGVKMMTWEAGAQQKAGQSRRFHHGYTYHVSLDRVVFIGFGGKNGLPESDSSANITSGSTLPVWFLG